MRLADGRALAYDRLVVSPGIDFMTSGVPGWTPRWPAGASPHSWKAGAQTVALRKQLEAMPDGGVFAMSIPASPYRCPPGPYERACMVASYFKTAKPKSKIIIYDANPDIQSKKGLFMKAWEQHYAGMIDYRPNSILRQVTADSTAKFDFEDSKAAVLNVIPQQRAGDIARAAGLVNMNDRWCGVNWLTLESTAVPGIHVLGDATMSAPAMPKSGHMANQHAKVAAAAIIQLLKGEPVNATPVVMNTCYSFVTAKDVVHVASVHQYDADGQDLQDGARLGRPVGRGEPDRRTLRAVLGAEHLDRHAGVIPPKRLRRFRPGGTATGPAEPGPARSLECDGCLPHPQPTIVPTASPSPMRDPPLGAAEAAQDDGVAVFQEAAGLAVGQRDRLLAAVRSVRAASRPGPASGPTGCRCRAGRRSAGCSR